jgi:nucleotide-binding universal stress UspA family protein
LFSLTKILIPIDFSERCLGATRYAIPLAEHFDSEISLLHVLPPFGDSDDADVNGVTIGEIMTARRAKAQKRMDDFLNAALHHLRVKRILLDGDPSRRIVEWGLRERSDLIMMPTHGYGPFRRLLLGSVTAKVLHDTDCPVLDGRASGAGATRRMERFAPGRMRRRPRPLQREDPRLGSPSGRRIQGCSFSDPHCAAARLAG